MVGHGPGRNADAHSEVGAAVIAGGQQDPERRTPLPPDRRWLAGILGLYVVLVVLSVCLGVPKKLPGIALGSAALLDIERAAAGLAILAAISIFAFQTSRGELPTQLGNFAGYPDPAARQSREDEVNRRVVERLENLERRVVPVENAVKAAEYEISLATRALADHEQRLVDLEPDDT